MSVIARSLDVSRSNIYTNRSAEKILGENKPRQKDDATSDAILTQNIREILVNRPTYGYRRITAILRKRRNLTVNHKKVYRVMKDANLLLQRFTGKPQRTHDGKVITLKSNTRWCTDAFGIQCWNGEQLQVAFSMDCCDREVISWVTSNRGICGELVRDLMTDTLEKRFPGARQTPKELQWLSDNGPGYTARQTIYHGRQLGFEICTTPSYSPQSNGMAEAFVKTFKRDYAYINDLSSAEAVRQQLVSWFEDYNENAPHKGLRMQSPRQYLAED